jgi:murein DD-endopeptidase MepM/ murein hydrolase activator NlpD
VKKRPVLAVVLATASAGALPALTGGEHPTTQSAAEPASLPSSPLGVETRLMSITRQHRALTGQLEQLTRRGREVHARTAAYGRAYVRRARAGLLPVGAGFQALVDHAAALERLRRAVARGLSEHRRVAQASTALMAAQDRARAFERAFASSGPVSHTAVYGSSVGPTDPSELSAGFSSMLGRLPFPLSGRAEVVTATRPGSDGSGLEMRASLGSAVRAVYPGRVAFADEYAAYGETVIIDHGDRFYTVYASLDQIGVSAGEDVSAGTALGTVGDSGSGPVLYFEIRRGAETIPAAEWFGI